MHEQGKALVRKLEEMRDGLTRDLAAADDVQLRKLSGGITVLTDILDDFAEHSPAVDE